MASNDRPVFFISSSMSELAEERGVVRKAVAKFADGTFETFCFEEDAVAQGGSPQDVWREQLERTDTTIGLLYQKMGQYTEEELRISRQRGIPILLFRKKDKEKVLEREAGEFIAWLEDAEEGITAKYFKTPKQLKQFVKEALARQQKELFSVARGARRSGTLTVDGVDLVEEAAPKIERRTEPPDTLRRQRVFVGRDKETTRLLGAIDRALDSDKRHIVIVGPDGIGKRALLRYVTHSGELEEFRDGTAVHPNWKEREDLEDLRQALWEQFYDTHNTVDPRTRDRQLREIEALVFLPEVDDDADIDDLIDETMPSSVFCTSRRAISTPVVPIKLNGLTVDADLLAVFEQHYGDVPEEAQASVVALCRSTEGNPGKIELLATQAMMDAPDDGDPESARRLAAWAADAAPGSDATPEEERVLRVVRDVGDVHTPREVLAEVAGSIDPVDRALDRGHLRSASPRYRLNPVLAAEEDTGVAPLDAEESLMPEVFAGTLRWVGTATHAEIFANRTFIVRMLTWAAEQGRWKDVIVLGRSAEASLAMGGWHGAWRELLDHVADAARQLDPVDETTLAWALHQLGARSLLRDELDDGRAQLFESFHLRRDDDDARDLTRRNLKLLPAAVLPWYALLLTVIIIVGMVWPPPEGRAPDIDVDFGRVLYPSIQTTGELELAGEGTVTVGIDDVTIDGTPVAVEDSGFCIVGDSGCADADQSIPEGGPTLCPVVARDGALPTVELGEPCVIGVSFTPPNEFGRFDAKLRLDTEDAPVSEGSVTAVVEEAVVEVDPDWQRFAESGEEHPFTVTNLGNVAIDVGQPGVRQLWVDAPSDAYSIVANDCGRLEPRDRCQITIRSSGTESGFLELVFTAVDDAVDGAAAVLGDGRVLLMGP